MEKTCPCGKRFFCPRYIINRKKYCSKKCFFEFKPRGCTKGLKYKIFKENPTWIKKGQRLSPETEFKKGHTPINPISKSEHRGKETEFKKDRKSWNKGIPHPAIHHEKHPYFISGKSSYVAHAKRNGKKPICEICFKEGEWGHKIHVHHIDENRNNNNINNLKILCSKCHSNLHQNWKKRKLPRRKLAC